MLVDDIVLYQDGADPTAPQYKFYDGTETLVFDRNKWLYSRLMPDGSYFPLNGVTNVVHIIDKSNALVPWAVKKALAKMKMLLVQRHYTVLPGVTGVDTYTPPLFEAVLDEIIDSAKRADKEELEAAGETGSIAHDWIEQLVKAILEDADDRRLELLAKLPLDERAANACIAACEWMLRHNVRWLATERKCFSREHGYAGTMDGLAFVDSCGDPECCPHAFTDRLTLVDWKTSNYLYVEYLFQTAAYQQAYQEETGTVIEDRWIIRLGKDDAEFDPWHVEGSTLFSQDFEGFSNCLRLSRSVEAVKDRVAAVQAAKVAYRRAVAKAARDARDLLACPASKTYQGKRKKKGCNESEIMCEKCAQIWAENGGKE